MNSRALERVRLCDPEHVPRGSYHREVGDEDGAAYGWWLDVLDPLRLGVGGGWMYWWTAENQDEHLDWEAPHLARTYAPAVACKPGTAPTARFDPATKYYTLSWVPPDASSDLFLQLTKVYFSDLHYPTGVECPPPRRACWVH
jgi:hypothetical protein